MMAVRKLLPAFAAVLLIACDTRPKTVTRADLPGEIVPAETLITRIPRVVRRIRVIQPVAKEVPPRVASITIVTEPTLWSGDRHIVGAVLRDSAGVELQGRAVAWATSDTSVIRVQSADSLHASVTGLLSGSAMLYAAVDSGSPRAAAQLNVIPVLAGRFVTIDGSVPPPMRLDLRVGARSDTIAVQANGNFTKRIEIFPDADVEVAAVPASAEGALRFHSVRLRRLSQRQLQNLRIALIPTSWRIDAGTYRGQTLSIDANIAMRRVSDAAPFWRLAPVSGIGPRTVLGWLESDLPLHVAFDRRGSSESISASDSVMFWDIAARMERDLGLSLFTPADMRDDTSRANFVRVEVSGQIADGHTFLSWSAAGDISDGVVKFRHATMLDEPHVVTHELLHLLGFGHSNAWTTVSQPMGGREQGLTPQDVAYVQLAMKLRRVQRETGAVPGLPVAIQ